jgi:hypothetical protein
MFLLRFIILSLLCGSVTAAPYFVQCYDFGCKSTQEIQFDPAQWLEIRMIFEQRPLDSAEEKQAIRLAIAAMERFSGEITGTDQDKGGNYPGSDIPRQMDCIDESTNTFQYLVALEQLNLLKWHRVGQKDRRIVWLATHWTATVTELNGESKFAVDSWYRDNGELPFVQPLADWRRKRSFPVAYNPELAQQ